MTKSTRLSLSVLTLMLGLGQIANAQLGGIRRRAEDAIGRGAADAVEKRVICAVTDKACQDKAKKEGKEVVIEQPKAESARPIRPPRMMLQHRPAPAVS